MMVGPVARRSATLLATVAAVSTLSSAAHGFWSVAAAGGGSGYSAADLTALRTTAAPDPAAALYPDATMSLHVSIVNPNDASVTVTGLARDMVRKIEVTPAANSTCTVEDAALTINPVTGLDIEVAGKKARTTTVAGVVHMGKAAKSGCQGATFTIPITLTGRN